MGIPGLTPGAICRRRWAAERSSHIYCVVVPDLSTESRLNKAYVRISGLKERIEARQQETTESAEMPIDPSTDPAEPANRTPAEHPVWFAVIDESATNQSGQSGLFRGIRLDSYLKLVDGVARMVRKGKHHLDANAEGILTRLNLCNRTFQDCLARIRYRMQLVM